MRDVLVGQLVVVMMKLKIPVGPAMTIPHHVRLSPIGDVRRASNLLMATIAVLRVVEFVEAQDAQVVQEEGMRVAKVTLNARAVTAETSRLLVFFNT